MVDAAEVVQVAGVDHHFGEGEARKQVLFDTTLDVGRGELVIMTGPSGSGKTTLLTLIGGLRAVQTGTLRCLGRDLARLSRDELVEHRRQVGFVFQLHNLFPALTAVQNVRLALDLQPLTAHEKRRRAEEILDRLGLAARKHAKPQQLSGGQRQRVAIARGLVHRPRLILADEPTAALDKDNSRDVVELFRTLVREDGATILMVTHDNRILDVADRIVNMIDGHIASNVAVAEALTLSEFLHRCELFAQNTPAELTEISQSMQRLRFDPGDIVVRQGDPGDRFFLIRRGEAVVEVSKDGGPPAEVARLGEGAYFGEAALLTSQPRNATVRALTPLETYTLDAPRFKVAVERSRSFREQLVAAIYSRR